MRCSLFAALAGAGIATTLWTSAWAQTPGGDPNSSAPFGSPVDDEHVWVHAILDQFEGRFGSENGLRWDGQAWTGTDTHRLWLKSEGELQNGKVSDGQHEILYDTPISTYFDLQTGLRYDLDKQAGRGWAAFGIEGLSQYFFHVSATAYASDTGHFGGKLFGSYDLLITQRLILQPEIELNLYTKADPKRLVGPGLSDIDTGLRLRYEISRKFAPYVGLSYGKRFGQTGRLAAAAGEKKDLLRFALGVRAWF
jgi:copper resistance protein B